MFEWIILGLVQGLAEWLPVSSEGLLTLTQHVLWPDKIGLVDSIGVSLWLHLGTWLAAVIYFRKELWRMFLVSLRPGISTAEDKRLLVFLLVSTVISGGLGYGLLELLGKYEEQVLVTGRSVMALVGILLLITGFVQLRVHGDKGKQNFKDRDIKSLSWMDGIVLGLAQGLAGLPGFSRSGLTVAALLGRKFNKEVALKLSFLMSLPIVLAGNIVLNIDGFWEIGSGALAGVVVAFLVGWITIDGFMKLARKVNFGWFVVGMGVLSLVAGLVG